MSRDVYSGRLKLNGEEDDRTLTAAYNYAVSLNDANRFEEGQALYRKTIPVVRRILGESHDLTLRMRWSYATALTRDANATLDDFLEALKTLTELVGTTRRVLGGAHPLTMIVKDSHRYAIADTRAALRARGITPPS